MWLGFSAECGPALTSVEAGRRAEVFKAKDIIQ